MQNILLIRLKSIGDVVLVLPAANLIRHNFPQARIAFLTSLENAGIAAGFPAVNEVLSIDRAGMRRGRLPALFGSTIGLLWRLRRAKFDLVVDFQNYGETAWLTWLIGAPHRWGHVYRPGRGWAYTKGITSPEPLQIADWNLALLHQCGLKPGVVENRFVLPQHALQSASEFFVQRGLALTKPTLFIQPLTSTPHKDWPLEKYLALARHWRAGGVQVLFGGGPADAPRLEPARQQGFVTAAGVPLMTSAGLARLSSVVVGGVTGLLHLAVAMQKRVVMLVGYAAAEPGFPYQHRDWAVTAPDSLPVSHITEEAVIEATARAFAEMGLR